MKINKISLIIIALILFGCETKKLTQKETELVNKLGFDINLINELKTVSKNELIQLPSIDNETGDILDGFYNGIYITTSEEKANLTVRRLKDNFKSKGYLIFVFEGESNSKNIGVIKGTDDLDILRYRRTDGINHGYENKDIVAKISEWDNKFGITVIGCGRDWLEVEFKNLPTDLDAFSKEVYKFCPDSVDQGVGEVEKLKEYVKETHGVWLWWD